MIKKLGLVFLLFIFSLLIETSVSYAKKSLLQRRTTGGSITGVIISPKLRGDRLALIINFNGLLRANSVTYTLSYNTNGLSQGVSGTIRPTADTDQRLLLFGTCSSGTCRYHTNLTNMKLVITSNLKSGAKVVKSFKVKP